MIPKAFPSPLSVYQFLVKDFDLQPWPYERFQLNYTTVGTAINDGTLPGVKGRNGVGYQIPANPEQLDAVIDAAKKQYGGTAHTRTQSSTFKVFLFVNAGLIIIGAVVYLFLRVRKARNA